MTAAAGEAPERSPGASGATVVVLGVAILIVSAAVRLYALGLNPFHHDEGINGWYVTVLAREGRWSYDPANYHGPTLFYFALASQFLFGLTSEAMRLVPAVFGTAIVALVLALRPFIGTVPALAGAALLAVSPGATYVSRYFIHESLVAFFTLAVVVALMYYVRERRQRYLVAAAASVALLLATKETGLVHLAVLGIAAGAAVAYLRVRGRDASRIDRRQGSVRGGRKARSVPSEASGWRRFVREDELSTAGLAFVIPYLLFYSSFLSNPKGVVDSLATFTIWARTGGETQVQPFSQYIAWLLQGDAPILVLGFLGGLLVAYRASSLTSVFIGLWALGVTLAYSLVSYKTPWIALNMLVPLAVLAGIGLEEAGRALSRRIPSLRLRAAAAAAVMAGAMAVSTYLAYDLNLIHYDRDGKYPYPYAHTTRSALELIDETQRIAAAAPAGSEKPGIVFVTPDYWPLPWYYRDYKEAAFFGSIVPTEEEMIVAKSDQEKDETFREIVSDRYRRHAVFTLRPGVDLVLYVRSDLAAS